MEVFVLLLVCLAMLTLMYVFFCIIAWGLAWVLRSPISSSIQKQYDQVTSEFNVLKKEIDQTHNEICKIE